MGRDIEWREAVVRLLHTSRPEERDVSECADLVARGRTVGGRTIVRRRPSELAAWRDRWPESQPAGRGERAALEPTRPLGVPEASPRC